MPGIRLIALRSYLLVAKVEMKLEISSLRITVVVITRAEPQCCKTPRIQWSCVILVGPCAIYYEGKY